MVSPVIRFELQIPNAFTGSADDNAFVAFLNTMRTLCDLTAYNTNVFPKGGTGRDNPVGGNTFFGYITSTQQAAALAALNILNTALSTGAAVTVVWTATTEP